MRIICPKCGTEYFLESEQLDTGGTPVQCSACEHTFTVYGPDAAKPDEEPRTDPGRHTPTPKPATPPPAPPPRAPVARPPPPPLARSRSASLFLAQGDRIYKVKDVATLQRWIVEKRVLPNDRVSIDGKSWDEVADRGDLRAFFAIIDQLKSAKRELRKQRVSGELGTADASEEDTRRPPGDSGRTEAVRETVRASAPSGDSVLIPMGTANTGETPPLAYGSGGMASPPVQTPPAASQSMPPVVPPPAAAASLHDPPAPALDDKAMSSPGIPGTPPPPSEAADSFFRKPAVPQDPFQSGQVATNDNLKQTRNVPVQSPTPPPAQVGESAIATPTGPRRSISDADIAIRMVNPSDDFDPDQTFEDEFYSRPSGRGFYLLLLLLAVAVGAALWYFLAGPGRGDVYSTRGTPTAEATPEPTPEATPEPTPEALADATSEPTAEPTPAVSAKPKPTATAKPTPKATAAKPTAAKPKPKPKSASRADHMKAADSARGRGQYSAAATAYEAALAADPKNFRAALQLGWMNVELGRNQAGIDAFKKALGLRSSSAESHYGLGLAYQARGQVQQAITHYERVVELDPDGRDTREVKAILRQLKP